MSSAYARSIECIRLMVLCFVLAASSRKEGRPCSKEDQARSRQESYAGSAHQEAMLEYLCR